MGAEEILSNFYGTVTYVREGEGWRTPFDAERLRGSKLVRDLIDADTGEVVAKAGDKITPRSSRKLIEAGLKDMWVPDEELIGTYVGADLIDETTGLVHCDAGEEVTQDLLVKIGRSEEHTSELQSLMRITYAVFCLKKKTNKH